MTLRLCVAKFDMLIEVQDGKVRGAFQPFFDSMYGHANKFFTNISLQTADSLGSEGEAGEMDGCLGMLQRNESDVHVPAVDFPVLGPGLDHGYPLTPSKIMMLSTYNSKIEQSKAEVLDAVRSFTVPLWILVLVTSLIFSVHIMKCYRGIRTRYWKLEYLQQGRKRLARQRFHQALSLSYKVLVGNMVKQHSSYSSERLASPGRFLLLMFAIFSFLILFFLTSLIKTEMLVQKRPVTISSYEDLLNRPTLRPIWARVLTDHWLFQNADRSSPEGRVWQGAVKLGLDESFLDRDTIAKIMLDVSHQRSVFLLFQLPHEFYPHECVRLLSIQFHRRQHERLVASGCTSH